MWKQRHGLPTVSCKGDAICNDQLVNFFKDKEHKIAFAQEFELTVF